MYEDQTGKLIKWVLGLVVVVIVAGLAIMPRYRLWSRELAGRAELAQANWNRQIKVREAQAAKEAAVQLAQAEIERAKGVAKANQIIGNSLKGNESYLHYLWVQGLHDGHAETIYVPTEAMFPVMEAGRRIGRADTEVSKK